MVRTAVANTLFIRMVGSHWRELVRSGKLEKRVEGVGRSEKPFTTSEPMLLIKFRMSVACAIPVRTFPNLALSKTIDLEPTALNREGLVICDRDLSLFRIRCYHGYQPGNLLTVVVELSLSSQLHKIFGKYVALIMSWTRKRQVSGDQYVFVRVSPTVVKLANETKS